MLVEEAVAHTVSPSVMETEVALKEQLTHATTASPCPRRLQPQHRIGIGALGSKRVAMRSDA